MYNHGAKSMFKCTNFYDKETYNITHISFFVLNEAQNNFILYSSH